MKKRYRLTVMPTWEARTPNGYAPGLIAGKPNPHPQGPMTLDGEGRFLWSFRAPSHLNDGWLEVTFSCAVDIEEVQP